MFSSTFAPHTIVPPDGGTQPLPPNPNPLLPNQAPPELAAEYPLDPVGAIPQPPSSLRRSILLTTCTHCTLRAFHPMSPGILSLFVSQEMPAPVPAASTAAGAAASEQPLPAGAPGSVRPALPRDAKRRRLVSNRSLFTAFLFFFFLFFTLSTSDGDECRPWRATRLHSPSRDPRARFRSPCCSSCRPNLLPQRAPTPHPERKQGWASSWKWQTSAAGKPCRRPRRTEPPYVCYDVRTPQQRPPLCST